MTVRSPKPVTVTWDGQELSGGESTIGGVRRLAIRTPRTVIVGLELEVDGEPVRVTALEQSLSVGFRLVAIESRA